MPQSQLKPVCNDITLWVNCNNFMFMMTPSMETFSALLAICVENSPVTGEFPAQRPVTRSFDVFFDLCLNKRLSKQWWSWWFETLSHPLWRHRNVYDSCAFWKLTLLFNEACQLVAIAEVAIYPTVQSPCLSSPYNLKDKIHIDEN